LDRPTVPDDLVHRYPEAEVERQLAALGRHGSAVDDPELWLRTALEYNFQFTPIETVERCPCGNGAHEKLGSFVHWNLLGVRRCTACGLVFVSPRLTRDVMDRIFNQDYFEDGDPEFWGKRRVPVFRDVTRWIRRFGSRSVYDVGAAYGHFVRWLTDRSIRASGCDLSAAAVEWGRENLKVDLAHGSLEDQDLPASSFDCVVSLDTLYYVSNPDAHLRAAHRVLKPGGCIILRLRTNVRVAQRSRKQGRKAVGESALPVPHLWGFTPRTASYLLARCGFRPTFCEAASFSVSRLSPLDSLLVRGNRVVSKLTRLPPLTPSFNIVAFRPDPASTASTRGL
jgi:SAM-dependent methyltransferase